MADLQGVIDRHSLESTPNKLRPITWRAVADLLESPADYSQLRMLDLSEVSTKKKREKIPLDLTGKNAPQSLVFLGSLADIGPANRAIIAEAIEGHITIAPRPNQTAEEYYDNVETTIRSVLRAGFCDELREKSPYIQLINKVEVGEDPEELRSYYYGVLGALELNEWREPGDGYRKPKEAFELCPDIIAGTVQYFQRQVGAVITDNEQRNRELHRILAHYEIESDFATAN